VQITQEAKLSYCLTADYLVIISDCRKIASPPVLEILGFKRIAVTTWPFRVTWRYRSRDHSIPCRLFPIAGPLEQRLCLYGFPRYSTANVTHWLT